MLLERIREELRGADRDEEKLAALTKQMDDYRAAALSDGGDSQKSNSPTDMKLRADTEVTVGTRDRRQWVRVRVRVRVGVRVRVRVRFRVRVGVRVMVMVMVRIRVRVCASVLVAC